jgi:diguanylate cyclase (GGDEF)-like protein
LDNPRDNYTETEQYFINNLDRALEEGWIIAYHQPLIRAASGRISDEEAFARWEDPDGRVFAATDFVPVLDREKLTYKLDLYMADVILEKLKSQAEHGFFMVPESINLSRSDFDSCDMVSAIVKKIDDAGIPRKMLSIELSEDVISSDVDFMKVQVERFQKEGLRVWMDDYGSGHTSMLILLKIRFNLLKIDKVFVDQISVNDTGRIILTELMRTALALGMDTVAEGVETQEQVDFLKEIGCTRLQGYYYQEPASLAAIIEGNQQGSRIGFENPEESDYYNLLSSASLYDLSISQQDTSSLGNYFDTLPMAIFSLDDDSATLIRCNKNFREFSEKNHMRMKQDASLSFDKIKPGVGYYSFNSVRHCAMDGKRRIIDDRLEDGRSIQLFIRRLAVNPVTGACAVGVVILSVSDGMSDESLTYNYVARALSTDYIKLYYADMDTGLYTEYSSHGDQRDITMERHGDNFFDMNKKEFDLDIPPEDKVQFMKEFTKERLEMSLENDGTFSLVTRVILDEKPVFVNVKAVKVSGNGNHIIVGLSNIDAQMKAHEALERAREERLIYSRIGALMGNYIYIYSVDPVTLHYTKYNPSGIVSDLGIGDEGDNFFDDIIARVPFGIYPEDVGFFLSVFTEENMMSEIEENGFFENTHRLNIKGEPVYVTMRATIVREGNAQKLIVGIFNIDEQIKREQSYEKRLSIAQIKANVDDLTGVKNKHAYTETEQKINKLISKSKMTSFAVAVFDLNGLKEINDTQGHQAGDRFIKKGSDTICRFFKHSPVFRVGGDEFVAIVTGYDYLNIDSIMSRFRKHNIKNKLKGDVVIAAGLSRFSGDRNVATVFNRADEEMYINKRELKT